MSLSYPFDEYALRRHYSPMNHHYGMGLHPEDYVSATVAAVPSLHRHYMRPWRHLAAAVHDVGSNIKVEKNKMQINLDVQHFSPDEISVKTVDGYIVVEGRHEEKQDDHGYVSRQFTRRYQLPEGAPPESVESRLSSDGVLIITAPTRAPAICGERTVPITHTGPVRKEIKDHPAIAPSTDKKDTK